MENYETLRSFEAGVEHFERRFRVAPEAIACDLHPNYLSTRYALQRAEREKIRTVGVQHHHAHIAACMAEHGLMARNRSSGWPSTAPALEKMAPSGAGKCWSQVTKATNEPSTWIISRSRAEMPADANYIPIEEPTLISTFTPLPPTNTPLPTLEVTATVLPSPTTAPTSSRTQYTLYALLDYYGNQLAVDETVMYTNQTGVSLDEIVMAVEPMHRGGFTMEHILLNGSQLNYDLSGHRLTVYLPQPLAPNFQLTLAMRFSIAIPPKVKEAPYGYDVDQVNLTDWYPFVVPYSGGWVLHDEYYLGEHLVFDAADFDVNVKTTDGNITIAASGISEPKGTGPTSHRLPSAPSLDQTLEAVQRMEPVDLRMRVADAGGRLDLGIHRHGQIGIRIGDRQRRTGHARVLAASPIYGQLGQCCDWRSLGLPGKN